MKYIKIHIKTHLKYWYLYLIPPIIFIPSYSFFFVSIALASIGINEYFSLIIGFAFGSFIISLPILFINYLAAYEMRKVGMDKINFILLFLINHIPFYLISLGMYILGFFWWKS